MTLKVGCAGVLALATVFLANSTRAGDRVNVRAMGMARSSAAISRGLDAVGTNPANLALPGDDVMTFTVLPFGVLVGSDFLTYDLFTKYFTGGHSLTSLSASDKQQILQAFQAPMGSSRAEAVARLFGMTLRTGETSSMAFSIDYGLVGAAAIPREYAQLLLFGNTPGTSYQINDLAIQAFWARTYTLSYGMQLPAPSFLTWLAAGAGVKMVQGYGYYEIQHLDASLATGPEGLISGSVQWSARSSNIDAFSNPAADFFRSPAGYGVGFDVGLSGGFDGFFSFGLSINDIGSVRWTQNAETTSSDSVANGVEPKEFMSIRRLSYAVGGSRKVSQAFSSLLPAAIRFGIATRVDRFAERDGFPGQLTIAAEFLTSLGPDSPISEQPRTSLGIEYKPVPWLPLRTGFSIGGSSASRLAFGFGFNFRWLDFDLGTEDILWLFDGRNFSSGSAGMSVRFRVPQ